MFEDETKTHQASDAELELRRLREEHSRLSSETRTQRDTAQLRHAQLKASEEELDRTRERIHQLREQINRLLEEQKKGQKLLRDSEIHYHSLVRALPMMLAIKDVERRRYIYWNRTTSPSGHTMEEWNALTEEEREAIYHPSDLVLVKQLLADWAADGYLKPLRLEFRLQDKSGEYRNIQKVIYREYASDGELIAQMELWTDVTPRFVEAALPEPQPGDLNLTADLLGELIYKVDAEGNIQWASPSFYRMFEKVPEDTLESPFRPDVHPEDLAAADQALATLRTPPHTCSFDQRVKTAQGWKWLAWNCRAEPAGDGTIAGVWFVGTDLTAQRKLQSRLGEFDARLIKILDRLDSLIYIFDASGNLVYLNPAIIDRLGYDRSELMNKNLVDFHPESHKNESYKVLSGIPVGRISSYSLPLARKDGSSVPVITSITSFTFDNREVFLAVSSDLERETTAPAAMPQSQSEPESQPDVKTPGIERSQHPSDQPPLPEVLQKFAGSSAHFLNNLLTVLNGHIQLLAVTIDTDGSAARDVEMMRKALQRGVRFSRRLLAYSGKSGLDPSPTDLNPLVEELVEKARGKASENVKLVMELQPDIPQAQVDAEQIRQALAILLENALQVTAEGREIRVITRLEAGSPAGASSEGADQSQRGQIIISISDGGPGIPEITPKVFEPFNGSDNPDALLGLGLATVHTIVTRNGGGLEVTSEPGRGTQVEIILPVKSKKASGHNTTREEESSDTQGSGTVLIADDDEAIREMTAHIVRGLGYRVLEAVDGQDALNICEKLPQPVDLAIVDVVMPNIDGLELVEKLRQRWPKVKVLFMSGYMTGRGDLPQTMDEYAPFLPKPFDPSTLIKQLKDLLEKPAQ